MLDACGVFDEIDTHRLGQRGAGQVVVSRPKPAGDDEHFRKLGTLLDRRRDPVQIVGHRPVLCAGNA